MTKKVVHYDGTPGRSYIKGVGAVAFVVAADHPDFSPGAELTTSRVIRLGENGEFETGSTIYRPLEQVNG